ncbi:hypothetical protein AALB_3348 [Agarivorans albus MKT 106]|uniref:Uncharacterized protein n=1 Tax=Agarivorans albus MKT 106 TaxID=1331007 RepID=R9PPQ2_AGAAL|nr:hypothetical protein AALB_3348 [Agarivorans albus MKT 106]
MHTEPSNKKGLRDAGLRTDNLVLIEPEQLPNYHSPQH